MDDRENLEIAEKANPKISIRNFLGKYPLLFYSVYRLKQKNVPRFTSRETQIVIEGFPRSANTYSVLAFQYAQSKNVYVAHHHHVPAQIIRGVNYNIPTIVLIRNPRDSIASLIIYDNSISISQALKGYFSFYRSILPYRLGFVIAPFEKVISDYPNIIRQVNVKFNSSFNSSILGNSEFKQKVSQITAPNFQDSFKVPWPSNTRNKFKEIVLEKMKIPRYRNLLKASEEIYREFINLATVLVKK